MDYIDLWDGNQPRRNSVRLIRKVSVIGSRVKQFGMRGEFGKVEMTVDPAEKLSVVDSVPWRKELEALGVAWPQCVIFGVLDILMFAEFGPLYKIRITLEDAEYHEVDSTQNAFREAGRDAGRNIVEMARRDRLIRHD
jgi:translation elongation factor EF-G